MKLLFLIAVTAILAPGCKHFLTSPPPQRYFPAGIYALAESCRFCRYWDTLVILHDRPGYPNIYRIARKTAYQFIQDSPLYPWRLHFTRWPATYSPRQFQMIPYGYGNTLVFLPDQNALTLKGEKYLRIE